MRDIEIYSEKIQNIKTVDDLQDIFEFIIGRCPHKFIAKDIASVFINALDSWFPNLTEERRKKNA